MYQIRAGMGLGECEHRVGQQQQRACTWCVLAAVPIPPLRAGPPLPRASIHISTVAQPCPLLSCNTLSRPFLFRIMIPPVSFD